MTLSEAVAGGDLDVMGNSQVSSTSRRYTSEFKERAVRMVHELCRETGQNHGTIQRVAGQVGCGVESFADMDQSGGDRPRRAARSDVGGGGTGEGTRAGGP